MLEETILKLEKSHIVLHDQLTQSQQRETHLTSQIEELKLSFASLQH